MQKDDTLLKISGGFQKRFFYIQKTLLASVSEALVKGLRTTVDVTYIDHASFRVLETFFSWLLSRRVEGGTQMSLVEVWRLGARYSIAPFQNEAMRRLVDILHSNPVDIMAMREAYHFISLIPPQSVQPKEALGLLRQAFVVQIAYQASTRSEHTLDKDEFAKTRMHTLAEFQEDLTHAVCIGFYDEDPDMPGVQLDKHLIEE